MKRLGVVSIIVLSACARSKPTGTTPPASPSPPSANANASATTSADRSRVAVSKSLAAFGDHVPSAGEDATSPSTADDDNVLVAKRWQLAAFFTKLKHKVRDTWNPAAVWKALPAVTRNALGTAQRETTVEASLAPDGTLVKLAIVKSSGVAELDAEAIRAFQVSSPFGTAPAGLTPFKFSFIFDVAGTSSSAVAP